MTLVVVSIAVLASAPLFAWLLARSRPLASLLDAFVLVAVLGIVALHVVPQSAGIAGPIAVALALAGVFLPILLHRVDDAALATGSRPTRRARDLILVAAFALGVGIHGTFDGTALAGAAATPSLAAAVLLHRLPVGLAFWTVVRPKIGLVPMLVVVGANVGGTVLGGVVGAGALTGASAAVLACVQAFVAGLILHIVTESAPFAPHAPPVRAFVSRLAPLSSPAPAPPSVAVRAAGVLGVALAVTALAGVELLEAAHAEDALAHPGLDASAALFALVLASAPALLLSFVLVGVLTALFKDGAPRIKSSARFVDAALGVGAGLPHPLCSCTVAPLYEEMLAAGSAPAAARAFLVAAPSLGVPAVLLTARLLGLPFTVVRAIGAALLALLAGLTASSSRASLASTAPPAPSSLSSSPSPALGSRLAMGMRHGLGDAVDHVMPWLILGFGVAALLEHALDEGALASLPPVLVTLGAALAALPLYLCAAGSTPVALLLVHKGASLGAALAFLLVAPATSMPTLAMLKNKHGTRAALVFAVVVAGGAFVLGGAVDHLTPFMALASPLDLHAAASSSLDPLAAVCAGALAILAVTSLYRQGVRGFLVQIMSPQHSHAGDHHHGPGCAHDHGPPLAVPVAGRPFSSTRAAGAGAPKRVALDFDPRDPRAD